MESSEATVILPCLFLLANEADQDDDNEDDQESDCDPESGIDHHGVYLGLLFHGLDLLGVFLLLLLSKIAGVGGEHCFNSRKVIGDFIHDDCLHVNWDVSGKKNIRLHTRKFFCSQSR